MPASFLDLSDIRPVPDNQECWFESSSNAMLVVELLEMRSDGLEFYFQNLVEENGGDAASRLQHQAEGPQGASGLGYYNKDNQRLCIHLGIHRVVSKQADVLVSLTIPCTEDENDPTGETTVFNHILSTLQINDMNLFVSTDG